MAEKPACISDAIDRAIARAAAVSRPDGAIGMGLGEVLHDGERLPHRDVAVDERRHLAGRRVFLDLALPRRRVDRVGKGTSTSWNGMSNCFIRIQGLSDQEEWHLLPMTRVSMTGSGEDTPPVWLEETQISTHETWPLSSRPRMRRESRLRPKR